MTKRRKAKPPKRDRAQAARLGRSAPALSAILRRGGAMGTHKRPRAAERRNAIDRAERGE